MCVSKSLRPFSLQSALVPARQPERKYLPWCGFVRGSVLFSLKEVLIYINASKSAFVLTRSWERQLWPDSWHFSAPYLGRTPPAPCPGAQCEDMSGNQVRRSCAGSSQALVVDLPLPIQEGGSLQGPVVARLLLVVGSPWGSPAPPTPTVSAPVGQDHCFPAVTAQGEFFCLGDLLRGGVNDL